MVKFRKWKPAIVAALCVGLGSQVSFTAFTTGFIITLAVVILGVFLSQYRNMNPFMITLLTAFWSPFFRGIIEYAQINDFKVVYNMVSPDVMFYIAYGVIYYFAFYRRIKKTNITCVVAIALSDWGANICEMMVRMENYILPIPLYENLLKIACLRSLFIFAIIIVIEKYKALLMSEEHEERYKKLIVMASVFNSEVYFMNKNMVEIEDVMKKSFSLYGELKKDGYPTELSALALDISKDVHEIKKDYIRVIQGLQDNFLSDINASDMWIEDIVQILIVDINEQIKANNSKVYFTVDTKYNFKVEDHFALMAVLRNLIMNSMEAIGENRKGYVELVIKKEGSYYVFTIFDNGPGIRKDEISVIYEPGFSTKFDQTTGDINRGVGLTLVHSIVEDVFDGSIFVESTEGSYTKFVISIPCESMKGEDK